MIRGPSGHLRQQAYTLYLYGSYPDYATTYTVDGQSDYAYGVFSGPAFVHNTHYALLQGLTPTAGTLTIHLDHYGTSKAATISGLQLVTPVPEPSTCVAGGVLLIAFGISSFRRIGARS